MSNIRKSHNSANASLISMMQRFSDVFIIFFGLYIVSLATGDKFSLNYIFMALGALVVFQMIGGITDFYRSWRGVQLHSEILLVLQNWTLSVILSAGLISFINVVDISFNIWMGWYLLVSIGITCSRVFIRYLIGIVRAHGYNTRNAAIVGNMPVGRELAESLHKAPWLGFRIVGIYSDDPKSKSDNIPFVNNIWQVVKDAKEGQIDRIYIAMSMREESQIKKLVDELCDTTCSVMLIPDIFTFNILQSRPEDINGVPVLSITDTPLNGINMVMKRIEDIIVAACILMFISPVLITIAFMVKITSSGPVIFRQVRYGIDGKPIKVWKFRSMSVMENGDKVVQAKKDDSRLTPIGGFLRRTSLDELPQFFNVLFGDMSIVGPRPHAVAHNEQYRSLIKGYMLRHKVKPGITGWAQINGWRGETDTIEKMEKRIEFDLAYIRNWSIWLDFKIIFMTIFKGFISKTAY
ncbi:undecaprenyl-phosphate glucose phosphotransferase [Winslowiella toletana]|uniref:undecaprenyl-phosphate glucose phosphotransferase n=1 Tax=Winslowiella toletana TaxID=92490 RepID=UPI0028BE992A|nr:undecaprenyl-phosphate glucose phosphotransferase [Winslowiella toletana]WNN42976.1 undecaprenyl-phosphate glucose phosphotransferase [Winslowiella toletana]